MNQFDDADGCQEVFDSEVVLVLTAQTEKEDRFCQVAGQGGEGVGVAGR